MTKQKRNRMILCLAIIFAGIFLDQLTKKLVAGSFALGQTKPLIPWLVQLTYWHNYGAAWGMLANHRWVFMVISTIAIAAMVGYLFFRKTESMLLSDISLSLIISGGIGNMIDRVFLGYVVDFIDIEPLFSFPIFNGADSFVCVGAGLLILATLLEIKAEMRAEKEKKAAKSHPESEQEP